jgi:MOSC N-terminal beta barrel domain
LSQINIYQSLKGIFTDRGKDRRSQPAVRPLEDHGQERKFFTQRELPKITTITVSVGEDGLRLSAPGAPDVTVEFEPESGTEASVRIWTMSRKLLSIRTALTTGLARGSRPNASWCAWLSDND